MNSLLRRSARRSRRTALLTAALAALIGCSANPTRTPLTSPSLGPRPASPASVEVVQPVSGSTIAGATAHIVLKLTGARIVPETTTSLRPDEGHVHLYVDNQLVSMNYGLEQDVPVHPGTFVVKAEFVAADHAPFSPRVWSNESIFTVRE